MDRDKRMDDLSHDLRRKIYVACFIVTRVCFLLGFRLNNSRFEKIKLDLYDICVMMHIMRVYIFSSLLSCLPRRMEVKSGDNDWKTPLPWHRNSCYHGVSSSGGRWTAHFVT